METPEKDSIWVHYNGLEYKVIGIANDGTNPKYPITVVYKGVHNNKVWTRDLTDWYRSFTIKQA